MRIYYTAWVRSGGELAAQAQLSFFAVEFYERRILRLSELAHLWNEPAQPGKNMEKAAWRGPMEELGSCTVRMSDCDSNQHLTSPKYLDFICDQTGFWAGETRMMTRLQIDYIKECMTGDHIRLGTIVRDGVYIVQGIHVDGRPCFNARFEYV